MANTILERGRGATGARGPATTTAAIGLTLVAVLAPERPAAQVADPPMRVSLDAEWSSFDRLAGAMMFRGLRIAQGDFTIQADEAAASDLNFDRSNWTFSGNVRIALDTTEIESARAEVVFESHELRIVELRGDPAEFRDPNPERGNPIRGGASVLRYDSSAQTLHMTGGAWLSEGPNEFRGCDLIYAIDEKKITSGSSECGEPVVITIAPPEDANGGDAEPRAPEDGAAAPAPPEDSQTHAPPEDDAAAPVPHRDDAEPRASDDNDAAPVRPEDATTP